MRQTFTLLTLLLLSLPALGNDDCLPQSKDPAKTMGDLIGQMPPPGPQPPPSNPNPAPIAVWPDPDPSPPVSPAPDDWKHQLDFSQGFEPFMVFDNNSSWTKFTIALDDKTKVFFQNANTHKFHHEFARNFLAPFRGLTRDEFDAVTLGPASGQPQKGLLGALLQGPWGSNEFGIQLVSNEPISKEDALGALELVKANLGANGGANIFYMPTVEQQTAAEGYADDLAAAGFPVASLDRWVQGDQCYAPGWAIGRIKYVPTADIDDAYLSGELKYTDILLTDAVPAEVPHVAGIISLSTSSDNSHVAILAESYGVPFVYPRDSAMQDELRALDGKEVTMRTSGRWGECKVSVTDATTLPPAIKEQILALKTVPPVEYEPKKRLGAYSKPIDELGDDPVAHFGGKAAGYALLREALSEEHTPKAVAFSFDLWDDMLSQPSPEDPTKTVKEDIAERMAPFQTYPPADLAALEHTLRDIRRLIRAVEVPQPVFDEVKAALADFDPDQKIRFRSSTNVEDSKTFVGAGLYSSYSGCGADDKDPDAIGPSHCDVDRDNERSVQRAMLRTMSSFYNPNAYLERLRRGVNEDEVGMSILAHHSFPDERELANGVATVNVRPAWSPGQPPRFEYRLVSQKGADSITNPDPNDPDPEIMRLTIGGNNNIWIDPEQNSNHPDLRLGESVMEQKDYEEFALLLDTAAKKYLEKHDPELPLKLDLEYKKVLKDDGSGETALIIKQIRPVPNPAAGNVPAVLITDSQELVIAQGEFGDVFGNHALKSRWTVTTDSRWLDGPNAALDSSFYTNVKIEYVEDGKIVTKEGKLSDFAGADHRVVVPQNSQQKSVQDDWTSAHGTNTLDTQVATTRSASSGPISTVKDAQLQWSAKLDTPLSTRRISGFDPNTGQPIFEVVNVEEVSVGLIKPFTPQDRIIDRFNFQSGNVLIQPRYRYDVIPPNIIIKTNSLAKWEQTTIAGLTTDPIVLKDYFSQTMRPGHHNFFEEFIFEPRLDPATTPTQLAELEAADIQRIYVDSRENIHVSGADGSWRSLP